jgi:hypothetical protein
MQQEAERKELQHLSPDAYKAARAEQLFLMSYDEFVDACNIVAQRDVKPLQMLIDKMELAFHSANARYFWNKGDEEYVEKALQEIAAVSLRSGSSQTGVDKLQRILLQPAPEAYENQPIVIRCKNKFAEAAGAIKEELGFAQTQVAMRGMRV